MSWMGEKQDKTFNLDFENYIKNNIYYFVTDMKVHLL